MRPSWKMLIVFALCALGLRGQAAAPVAAPAATLTGPVISWAGCGASYGTRPGATCAFALPVITLRGMYSWTAFDYTFSHGIPAQTISTGYALDAWFAAKGNFQFQVLLLTTAGITSTPSATTGAFGGGASLTGVYRKHWTGSVVYRTVSGAGENRILSAMAGWKF